MRELAIGGCCVLGLLAVFAYIGKGFDTPVRTPAHALELANVRVEASAAKAEADQARAEVARLKEALKAAEEERVHERWRRIPYGRRFGPR
jgi:hypothetical protein